MDVCKLVERTRLLTLGEKINPFAKFIFITEARRFLQRFILRQKPPRRVSAEKRIRKRRARANKKKKVINFLKFSATFHYQDVRSEING